MNYGPSVLSRLKRIEGQVRGVEKMIEQGRDCTEVVQQLKALQAATNATTQLVIKQYLAICIKDLEGSGNHNHVEMARLFSLIEYQEE